MLQKKRWMMELWKFSDRVLPRDLDKVARGWANDRRYLQLCIRRIAPNQLGICFIYQIPDGKNMERFQAKYVEITSDALRKLFGRRFVGLDVACGVYLVR